MQPDLRGGDRDPELFGDRLVREVVHVLQHHDAAQLGRQLVEGERDSFERFGRLRHRGGLEVFGRSSAGSRSSSNGSACWRRRRFTWVAAALAVIRYIQVENCGLAPELADASPRSQVGVLDHVAPVLFVAGQATRERERVNEGSPDELIESLSVARLRGTDQLGLVQSELRSRDCGHPTWSGPKRLRPRRGAGGVWPDRPETASGSLCAWCGACPSGSTSSSRCARGR